MLKPPYTNRGAQITSPPSPDSIKILVPSENRILVDYVSGTFTHTDDPHEVLELLGLDTKLFVARPKGALGYKQAIAFGNITVLFDGSKNMGVHFSMSGEGCRQYESQFFDNPWLQVFKTIIDYKGNLSRLDLANDNVDGFLSLDRLQSAIDNHEVRTRFKRGKKIEAMTFHDNDDAPIGKTLYLNQSRQSLVFMRFYDKAAQCGLVCHWVRAEIELKGVRALVAAKALIDGMACGELFFSIMNTYFSVINLDDTNKTRCSTAVWWAVWLESTSKIKLTLAKVKKKIEDTKRWFQKSIAPSLAMMSEYMGSTGFSEFVNETVENGKKRMGVKHYDIIWNSNELAVLDLPF